MGPRRKGAVPRSAVADLIKEHGGVRQFARLADMSTEGVYQARARGTFTLLKPILRLVETLYPGNAAKQLALARRLAGL
jgi:DNA-binding phage protein